MKEIMQEETNHIIARLEGELAEARTKTSELDEIKNSIVKKGTREIAIQTNLIKTINRYPNNFRVS